MESKRKTKRAAWRPLFWGALGMVACAVVVVAALPSERTVLAQSKEPPLQFLLQVEGKSVPVMMDRAFEVEVSGQTIKMTLTAKPYRVFDANGVRFKYQRHYAFEMQSGDTSTEWWLSGNDNKIMLTKLNLKVDPAMMLDAFLEGIPTTLKGANFNPSDVSIRLHGRSIHGKRFNLAVGDFTQRKDIFAFSHRGTTFLLGFQSNILDSGGRADEAVKTRKMLEESFEFRSP